MLGASQMSLSRPGEMRLVKQVDQKIGLIVVIDSHSFTSEGRLVRIDAFFMGSLKRVYPAHVGETT